jgi:hypothetical protein
MARLWMVVVCAGVVAMGCSNPTSGDGGPQGLTVSMASYLPLEDGFTWTYVDSRAFQLTVTCEGPQTIAGYSVYCINEQYFYLNSDGWYFVDYPYYTTPVRVMPAEIAAGSTCSGQGSFSGLTWTCVSTDESVAVEAGNFADCIEIKEVGKVGTQVTTERHLWFAPGVGLVKQRSIVGGGCDSGYIFAMGDAGLLEIELSAYAEP